jgi:DNA-binding XRE family transcriptional regulator
MMEVSNWREIRSRRLGDQPGLKDGIEQQRRLLELEVGLADLRRRRGVTQANLSDMLAVTQANVSRIEHEDDLYLSTLARYVAGLGGRLSIHAEFDDEDVRLTA